MLLTYSGDHLLTSTLCAWTAVESGEALKASATEQLSSRRLDQTERPARSRQYSIGNLLLASARRATVTPRRGAPPPARFPPLTAEFHPALSKTAESSRPERICQP